MSKQPIFKQTIQSEDELRKIIGYPSELVKQKVIYHIDEHCRDFIAQSPFLVMSTSNNKGLSDTSPRGDKPGFVHIIDSKHLIIPERPGNRRIDSMVNIITNPFVSLLFFIPALGETLRVKGKANLVTDELLLNELQANGKIPAIAIGIEVQECFIHCAKAILRSDLWNSDTWSEKEDLPKPAKILAAHANHLDINEKQMEQGLQESYAKGLY